YPIDSTSATVNWTTSVDALSQVYYRLVSGSSTPIFPTGTLSRTIYRPFIGKSLAPWLSTNLVTSPKTSHAVTISGLQPGSTYEYLVASRGASSGGCVTWVSTKKEFTTLTTQ
ncbi:MAG: fibronectin type III domain-containing protein, partial [Anaerolineae bacterium]